MPEKIELELATKGADRQHRDLRRAAGDTKKVGEETERAGRKSERAAQKTKKLGGAIGFVDKIIKGSIASVTSWVGAFLGIGAVISLVNQLIARLERIREIQNQIAQESLSLQEVALRVSGQLGLARRGQEGLDIATGLITDIMKVAGIKSPEAASGLIIGADVALPGEDFIRDKLPVLKAVAPIVGAKSLSSEASAALFALLNVAGRTENKRQIQESIARVLTGYGKSPATAEGPFIVGMQKAAPAFIGTGGSFEDLIGRFTQARIVTASEEEAATLVNRAVRVLTKPTPELRKRLQSVSGGRFAGMAIEERMWVMEQVVAEARTPEERDILLEDIGILNAAQLMAMLSEGNRSAICNGLLG